MSVPLVTHSGVRVGEILAPAQGWEELWPTTEIFALAPEQIRALRIARRTAGAHEQVFAPEGAVQKGVKPELYHAAKRGVVLFCADIVVTTYLPNGVPAAAFGVRRPDGFLGGIYWHQGGVNFTAGRPEEHVREKARKELGIDPLVEAPMGLWMTTAWEPTPGDGGEPYVATTGQVGYAGYAPFEVLMESMAPDKDHEREMRLLTAHDLMVTIEPERRHQHVMRVGLLALSSMPSQAHYRELGLL
jgi:hypothetical protein